MPCLYRFITVLYYFYGGVETKVKNFQKRNNRRNAKLTVILLLQPTSPYRRNSRTRYQTHNFRNSDFYPYLWKISNLSPFPSLQNSTPGDIKIKSRIQSPASILQIFSNRKVVVLVNLLRPLLAASRLDSLSPFYHFRSHDLGL